MLRQIIERAVLAPSSLNCQVNDLGAGRTPPSQLPYHDSVKYSEFARNGTIECFFLFRALCIYPSLRGRRAARIAMTATNWNVAADMHHTSSPAIAFGGATAREGKNFFDWAKGSDSLLIRCFCNITSCCVHLCAEPPWINPHSVLVIARANVMVYSICGLFAASTTKSRLLCNSVKI